MELQFTEDEAQSTHKTVRIICTSNMAACQYSPECSDFAEGLHLLENCFLCVWECVRDFMFFIWMIVNAAMCVSWHTNSDMSGIDCVVV